ncbi:hypothetical protein [Bacillus sp. SM2101]|uniref:hypothetical protein n=1 Tax=Bacillus sp. SM2101 TaxID=2805366 RepID=UPI001BDE38D9|nr:hypothetical protein [Bacillus sp. SM2101]
MDNKNTSQLHKIKEEDRLSNVTGEIGSFTLHYLELSIDTHPTNTIFAIHTLASKKEPHTCYKK